MKVNKITPCFLGLFDTVSSYGLNFENDVKELTLEVSHPEKVVQSMEQTMVCGINTENDITMI